MLKYALSGVAFRGCLVTGIPAGPSRAAAAEHQPPSLSVLPEASVGAGQVECGDVAEGHRGADGRARAGVAVAHHGYARVAGRVEAGDRGTVLAQHAGSLVGAQPALGAEVAGNDLDRVERRLRQRGQVRVGPAPRVAVVAVVGGVTAAEVRVP